MCEEDVVGRDTAEATKFVPEHEFVVRRTI
jgi:hypothetical protein